MDNLLNKLADEIKDYTENVAGIRPVPQVSLGQIESHLSHNYSFENPRELSELTTDVIKVMRNWSLHTNHPNYFGLFVPGTMPASVIADALVALYNPQLGVWSHSPIGVEIERHTLKFLLNKFGYDPKTSSGKLQRSRTRQQYLDGTLAGDGVRTFGQKGAKLTVAKHVVRSVVSRVRHQVKDRASGIIQALRRPESTP